MEGRMINPWRKGRGTLSVDEVDPTNLLKKIVCSKKIRDYINIHRPNNQYVRIGMNLTFICRQGLPGKRLQVNPKSLKTDFSKWGCPAGMLVTFRVCIVERCGTNAQDARRSHKQEDSARCVSAHLQAWSFSCCLCCHTGPTQGLRDTISSDIPSRLVWVSYLTRLISNSNQHVD